MARLTSARSRWLWRNWREGRSSLAGREANERACGLYFRRETVDLDFTTRFLIACAMNDCFAAEVSFLRWASQIDVLVSRPASRRKTRFSTPIFSRQEGRIETPIPAATRPRMVELARASCSMCGLNPALRQKLTTCWWTLVPRVAGNNTNGSALSADTVSGRSPPPCARGWWAGRIAANGSL